MGPQGLCEAEIEEAVLGQHVSQEPHGRLAQVPLPEEVFLGTARPASGPRQARPTSSVPTPGGRGALPAEPLALCRFPGPWRYGPSSCDR